MNDITQQDVLEYREKIRNLFPGNSYREVNIESYYQELILKENKSEAEEGHKVACDFVRKKTK